MKLNSLQRITKLTFCILLLIGCSEYHITSVHCPVNFYPEITKTLTDNGFTIEFSNGTLIAKTNYVQISRLTGLQEIYWEIKYPLDAICYGVPLPSMHSSIINYNDNTLKKNHYYWNIRNKLKSLCK